MFKYIITPILAITTLFSVSQAQYLENVVRFSQTPIEGTARAAAMGNAFGALGGDFTSLSINPAGIGVYRTNEFSITPSFITNKTDISLNTNSFSENENQLNLGQLGFVGSVKVDDGESLVRVNFGVGFNTIANFDRSYMIGNNRSSISLLDDIVGYTNTEHLSNAYLSGNIRNIEYRDWKAKLAWEAYLMDPVEDENGDIIDGEYVSILNEGERVDQEKSWISSGSINEFVLSTGLNFNHKFYLGATIGIQDIYYRLQQFYTEEFTGDYFDFLDSYKITGSGYNFKLGAIYKPIQEVRLGLAYHTPTFYDIDEETYLSMNSSLGKNPNNEGLNLWSYNLHTPSKIIASGAFVLAKRAILSFDAEYLDYGVSKYKNKKYRSTINDLNSEISNNLDQAFNFRVGGEFKATQNFSIRGGYEFYQSPYTSSDITTDLTSYSFGFGYALKHFYIDATFKQYHSESNSFNDEPNYEELQTGYKDQRIMLTMGFRF